MRIFSDLKQAQDEIRRDLSERSVEIKTTTYQNKTILNDPEMVTKEILNYSYEITNSNPGLMEPNLAHLDWAQAEWQERRSALETYSDPGSNPGGLGN